MAYNPAMYHEAESEAKALVPITTNRVRPLEKREYYMEWWKLGSQENDIRVGYFHSGKVKAFVKMFMNFKSYNIIYLERVHDKKVLWNRRAR